jgi:hypothetical protein
VLLPKKESKSKKAKRKDQKPFDQIFSSDSDNEADASGSGKTNRTRYWHIHKKTAGYLADRAVNGFVEHFGEMDPSSVSQEERACVTRFLQQGIASAYPPSKLGDENGGCSVL